MASRGAQPGRAGQARGLRAAGGGRVDTARRLGSTAGAEEVESCADLVDRVVRHGHSYLEKTEDVATCRRVRRHCRRVI